MGVFDELAKPGVTLIAVLALTLGIGLTTTIFSVVYGILLRALPFEEPQQIVHQHGSCGIYAYADDGVTLDEAAIRRACAEQLESAKVPQHVALVASLPRTTSGKMTKLGLS